MGIMSAAILALISHLPNRDCSVLYAFTYIVHSETVAYVDSGIKLVSLLTSIHGTKTINGATQNRPVIRHQVGCSMSLTGEPSQLVGLR